MANNFKKVGRWGAADKLTKDIKKDIYFTATKELMRLGLETERKVVKYIQRQPSIWPALSDEYKERKAAQGYSNLMLRRTGDYINRITSSVASDRMSVFIGVRKGVRSKDGSKLWQIGAVLEYGRKGDDSKARPHFRPVNRHMRKKIEASNVFSEKTMAYLKQKYSM